MKSLLIICPLNWFKGFALGGKWRFLGRESYGMGRLGRLFLMRSHMPLVEGLKVDRNSRGQCWELWELLGRLSCFLLSWSMWGEVGDLSRICGRPSVCYLRNRSFSFKNWIKQSCLILNLPIILIFM